MYPSLSLLVNKNSIRIVNGKLDLIVLFFSAIRSGGKCPAFGCVSTSCEKSENLTLLFLSWVWFDPIIHARVIPIGIVGRLESSFLLGPQIPCIAVNSFHHHSRLEEMSQATGGKRPISQFSASNESFIIAYNDNRIKIWTVGTRRVAIDWHTNQQHQITSLGWFQKGKGKVGDHMV